LKLQVRIQACVKPAVTTPFVFRAMYRRSNQMKLARPDLLIRDAAETRLSRRCQMLHCN
jgi:hypothetical protein